MPPYAADVALGHRRASTRASRRRPRRSAPRRRPARIASATRLALALGDVGDRHARALRRRARARRPRRCPARRRSRSRPCPRFRRTSCVAPSPVRRAGSRGRRIRLLERDLDHARDRARHARARHPVQVPEHAPVLPRLEDLAGSASLGIWLPNSLPRRADAHQDRAHARALGLHLEHAREGFEPALRGGVRATWYGRGSTRCREPMNTTSPRPRASIAGQHAARHADRAEQVDLDVGAQVVDRTLRGSARRGSRPRC